MTGLNLAQLVNTKSQTYKKIRPDLASMGESEVARLIKENPKMMVRPVLADSRQAVVGFNENGYRQLMG